MSLTSRQRFLKVLNKEMPDRVPVTLFVQDQGHFINQIYPEIDPQDSLAIQLKVIEFQRQMGVDVFVRLLFGVYEPVYWRFGGVNVDRDTENWEVHNEETHQNENFLRRSTIRTPDGELTQEFAIYEIRPGTFLYACTKKPIQTPADLKIAAKYEPGMAETFPQQVNQRVKVIREALGEDGIIGVWSPNGPFNTASRLIDESDLYALFLTEPEFYHDLMEFSIARVLETTRAIDAAGIDAHIIGGNVAGGFLGKRNYDRHILPYEKRFIDIVQENGTPAVYHNCGQIMNLIESYKELGVRWVEPFSPPPKLGDADLRKVKEVVGDAYVITGGVDQVLCIQQGSVDDVKRATEETMKIGKPGGNFIIQNADFLEYGTPLENVEAFVSTALDNSLY
jgi:uroporphyrinogen-III decarboxylase